jgi:hypothetical protein
MRFSGATSGACLSALALGLFPGCIASEVRYLYAAAVESYVETPFADRGAPYIDAERALGPPDGRTVALGVGGSVTLRFFEEIPNGAGPDLRIIEIGHDGARARVAVSADGVSFREFALPASSQPTSEFELDDVGLEGATFVRLRGTEDGGLDHGFDLDAVEALN